ncbi:MAG: winged helix DNA-binding domain-containing protein [Propionibacteriaceae bacterium]
MTRRRVMTVRERRALMVHRHLLAGDGESVEQVVESLIALHATDPATVYLSVLARTPHTTLAGIGAALNERRSLVRWMAMRRTLFVLPRGWVPIVQAAASMGVAAALRRQLVRHLIVKGTDPAVDGDVEAWLADVEATVVAALRRRRVATALQLSRDEPRLRTSILPQAKSEVRQNVTSRLLVLMATEAKLVRGESLGGWTTRRNQWEPISSLWPDGLPVLTTAAAQIELARRWLHVFGPAPLADLEWWTGWTKAATRAAVASLDLQEVDLDGAAAVALADDPLTATEQPPSVILLPSLDPTPMGWKRRDWFFGIDQTAVFDRFGNIGPTVW